jgi:hypothetical protein
MVREACCEQASRLFWTIPHLPRMNNGGQYCKCQSRATKSMVVNQIEAHLSGKLLGRVCLLGPWWPVSLEMPKSEVKATPRGSVVQIDLAVRRVAS